jgi:hypothetical protein
MQPTQPTGRKLVLPDSLNKFSRQLLNIYYVPGTFLAMVRAISQEIKTSVLMESAFE